MILVDTSAWIEVFRRNTDLDITTIAEPDQWVTCPPIIQEVLQGFRDERAFRTAREAMLALPIIGDPLDIELHLEAAELYRAARRQGLTLRSSVDCLIGACALRHDLPILHRDRDYRLIAQVSPLKEVPIPGP